MLIIILTIFKRAKVFAFSLYLNAENGIAVTTSKNIIPIKYHRYLILLIPIALAIST
jgi:hypothetical protein